MTRAGKGRLACCSCVAPGPSAVPPAYSPGMWRRRDLNARQPAVRTRCSTGLSYAPIVEPSGFEPLTACMPCRCTSAVLRPRGVLRPGPAGCHRGQARTEHCGLGIARWPGRLPGPSAGERGRPAGMLTLWCCQNPVTCAVLGSRVGRRSQAGKDSNPRCGVVVLEATAVAAVPPALVIQLCPAKLKAALSGAPGGGCWAWVSWS